MVAPIVRQFRMYIFMAFFAVSVLSLFVLALLTVYDAVQPVTPTSNEPWAVVDDANVSAPQDDGFDLANDSVGFDESALERPLLP